MIRNLLLLILFSSFLSACWDFRNRTDFKEKVVGYKPVYSNDPSLLTIAVEAPKAVKNAGKIYALGNYIFQNELGQGIHVIDKTNPSQLANLGFLTIRGNTELSIKGGYLYANSFNDLVIVDISDWRNPKEIKRIKQAFNAANFSRQPFIPVPEKNVYTQCIDPAKGIQTGWIKDTIFFSDCYFYNN